MADKVTWFELPADDVKRAGEFYSTVFGWNMSDMGGGSLAAVSGPSDDSLAPLEAGSINGDISPRSEGFDRPLIVISVEDMAAKIEALVAAGGKVVLEPQEMEGMDMLWAIVSDTEGNNIGLTQDT